MSGVIKMAYETFDCTYTCGLSLSKFLRFLSLVGMLSSLVYTGVGSYIIVHIVQTEKVEWFPNAYYRLPEGPIASRIVLPRQPYFQQLPQNVPEDFEVRRPKQFQHLFFEDDDKNRFTGNSRLPFQQQHTNFPSPSIDKDEPSLKLEEERAIYYRRNVELFICLAATLIIINLIQFIADTCLFLSTFTRKKSTSYWVFFLLNIILWIMTLICFITIFSGGGIFLLLVFLTGTAIRVYMVYILHEFMSDIRKPRAYSGTSVTGREIKPEPRTLVGAECGQEEESESIGENIAADDVDAHATDENNIEVENGENNDDMNKDFAENELLVNTLEPSNDIDENVSGEEIPEEQETVEETVIAELEEETGSDDTNESDGNELCQTSEDKPSEITDENPVEIDDVDMEETTIQNDIQEEEEEEGCADEPEGTDEITCGEAEDPEDQDHQQQANLEQINDANDSDGGDAQEMVDKDPKEAIDEKDTSEAVSTQDSKIDDENAEHAGLETNENISSEGNETDVDEGVNQNETNNENSENEGIVENKNNTNDGNETGESLEAPFDGSTESDKQELLNESGNLINSPEHVKSEGQEADEQDDLSQDNSGEAEETSLEKIGDNDENNATSKKKRKRSRRKRKAKANRTVDVPADE